MYTYIYVELALLVGNKSPVTSGTVSASLCLYGFHIKQTIPFSSH